MSKTIWKVIYYVIAVTGITLILISFFKDQLYPYLPIGCACTFITNAIGCKTSLKRYNPCRRNNSPEDM